MSGVPGGETPKSLEGQSSTTPLGLLADRFESLVFPVVFVFLAAKDAYKLQRDWPAIKPALAAINPLVPTSGDFITLASVLMLVYLILISLLSAFLLVRRSGKPKRTPDNWIEIVVPFLATFGAMANSFLIDIFPASLDVAILPASFRGAATVSGSLLVIAGLLLGFTAEWHLNTSYGVFVQVRDPVMTGLYAYVRHPMYASYFLVNVGIFLLNPMFSYLILQFFYISLLVYRARLEEAKLSDFSPEYKEYKARTPMIVPRLWLPSAPKSRGESVP
jgi:protein-S-isoprenylcysteine O-methyltransferase Ste14